MLALGIEVPTLLAKDTLKTLQIPDMLGHEISFEFAAGLGCTVPTLAGVWVDSCSPEKGRIKATVLDVLKMAHKKLHSSFISFLLHIILVFRATLVFSSPALQLIFGVSKESPESPIII